MNLMENNLQENNISNNMEIGKKQNNFLLKEGLSEGIKKVVSSAIDLGKSAIRNSYRKF